MSGIKRIKDTQGTPTTSVSDVTGLGNAATKNVGTGSGDVAAGDAPAAAQAAAEAYTDSQVDALTKSDVGLDQVDNTSDANKPVSTATSDAIAVEQVRALAGEADAYSTAVATSADDATTKANAVMQVLLTVEGQVLALGDGTTPAGLWTIAVSYHTNDVVTDTDNRFWRCTADVMSATEPVNDGAHWEQYYPIPAAISHAETMDIDDARLSANVVLTDDARLSDNRNPLDNSVATASLQDDTVTPTKMNAMSTFSGTIDFMRSDGVTPGSITVSNGVIPSGGVS